MAPEPEILKRKRNRPRSWWAAAPAQVPPQGKPPRKGRHQTSNTKDPERPYQAAEGTADKEKGTRSKAVALVAEAQNHERDAPAANRGRPSKVNPVLLPVEEGSGEAVEGRLSKRKRKRPSDFWVVQDGAEEQHAAPTIADRRKPEASCPAVVQKTGEQSHPKRGLGQRGEVQLPIGAGSSKDSSVLKKQANSSATVMDPRTQHVATSSAKENKSGRSRGNPPRVESRAIENSTKNRARRNLEGQLNPELEVQTATSSFGRARNGRAGHKKHPTVAVVPIEQRPKKTRRSQVADADLGAHSNPSKSYTVKKVGSTSASKFKQSGSLSKAEGDFHKAKRRRTSTDLGEGQNESIKTDKVPTYQHLAAVTRRIPRQTIATWEPLAADSIERVSQLLKGVERPVVMHLHDEHKRDQASAAIHMVTRKLVKRISKGLPFPPGLRGQREDYFDFEKLLDNNRVLDSQLTPALHANELLKCELSKEKAFLESERADLADLEANAKSESLKRKQAGRKVHALLQSEDVEEDLGEELGLDTDTKTWPFPLITYEDDDLLALTREMQGHVDSMNGNVSQIQGISEAMAKGKAAVQATLFGHLESKQYEGVVLG